MNTTTFITRLRHYPLSVLLIVAIWTVCLIPIPETPLSDVRFIDKWTHTVLYLVLALCLGMEYWRSHKTRSVKAITLLCLVFTVAMGGLVEIVQATCTGGVRHGDWPDFLADTIGSLAGYLLIFVCHNWRKQ